MPVVRCPIDRIIEECKSFARALYNCHNMRGLTFPCIGITDLDARANIHPYEDIVHPFAAQINARILNPRVFRVRGGGPEPNIVPRLLVDLPESDWDGQVVCGRAKLSEDNSIRNVSELIGRVCKRTGEKKVLVDVVFISGFGAIPSKPFKWEARELSIVVSGSIKEQDFLKAEAMQPKKERSAKAQPVVDTHTMNDNTVDTVKSTGNANLGQSVSTELEAREAHVDMESSTITMPVDQQPHIHEQLVVDTHTMNDNTVDTAKSTENANSGQNASTELAACEAHVDMESSTITMPVDQQPHIHEQLVVDTHTTNDNTVDTAKSTENANSGQNASTELAACEAHVDMESSTITMPVDQQPHIHEQLVVDTHTTNDNTVDTASTGNANLGQSVSTELEAREAHVDMESSTITMPVDQQPHIHEQLVVDTHTTNDNTVDTAKSTENANSGQNASTELAACEAHVDMESSTITMPVDQQPHIHEQLVVDTHTTIDDTVDKAKSTENANSGQNASTELEAREAPVDMESSTMPVDPQQHIQEQNNRTSCSFKTASSPSAPAESRLCGFLSDGRRVHWFGSDPKALYVNQLPVHGRSLRSVEWETASASCGRPALRRLVGDSIRDLLKALSETVSSLWPGFDQFFTRTSDGEHVFIGNELSSEEVQNALSEQDERVQVDVRSLLQIVSRVHCYSPLKSRNAETEVQDRTTSLGDVGTVEQVEPYVVDVNKRERMDCMECGAYRNACNTMHGGLVIDESPLLWDGNPASLVDAGRSMLLEIISVCPDGFFATSHPSLRNVGGLERASWALVVKEASCKETLFQALVVLVSSLDKSKFPEWWKAEGQGWSVFQHFLSEMSWAAFFLELEVLDLCISEATALVAAEPTSMPPGDLCPPTLKEMSYEGRVRVTLQRANDMNVPLWNGDYRSVCSVCLDGGELMCCELCFNTAHQACYQLQQAPDRFVCYSCMADLDTCAQG